MTNSSGVNWVDGQPLTAAQMTQLDASKANADGGIITNPTIAGGAVSSDISNSTIGEEPVSEISTNAANAVSTANEALAKTIPATAEAAGLVKPGTAMQVAQDGTINPLFGTTAGTVADGGVLAAAQTTANAAQPKIPAASSSLLTGPSALGGAPGTIAPGTAGRMLLDGGDAWAPAAMSGDASLSSTGALTITKSNGTPFGSAAFLETAVADGVPVLDTNAHLALANVPDLASTGLTSDGALLSVTYGTESGTALEGSLLGAPSGVTPLDSSGYVPLANTNPALIGSNHYIGVWNASTNTPAIASGTSPGGTNPVGSYYVVDVAGTTTVDGVSVWNVGDWIIWNGTIWNKLDGQVNPVSSFNSRQGAINLLASDISGVGGLVASFGFAAGNAIQGGSQSASFALAAPAGSAGTPSWRRLAYADISGLGTAAQLTAGGANGAAVLDANGGLATNTVLPIGGDNAVSLGDFAGSTLIIAPQLLQSQAAIAAQSAIQANLGGIIATSITPVGAANGCISFGIGSLNPLAHPYGNTFQLSTAFGYGALAYSPQQPQITALGAFAFAQLGATGSTTYAGSNVAVGAYAGANLLLGQSNTFVGGGAGLGMQGGAANCAFGHGSMTGLDVGKQGGNGSQNSCFGTHSGQDITTGNNNTLIGSGTGTYVTTGNLNTYVGVNIGGQNGQTNSAPDASSNLTGFNNTIVGADAFNNTGDGVSKETAVGYAALQNDTVGSQVAVGYQALNASKTGVGQIAVGFNAMQNADTGSQNIGIGNQSLLGVTGSNNVALGNNALYGLTSGSNNTAVGFEAGFGSAGSGLSVTDLQCTFIGSLAARDSSVAAGTALTNAIAIGYAATVATSNTVVLGNASVLQVIFGGINGINFAWGGGVPSTAPAGGLGGFFWKTNTGAVPQGLYAWMAANDDWELVSTTSTWAAPPTIGSTTPAAGTFKTVALTENNTAVSALPISGNYAFGLDTSSGTFANAPIRLAAGQSIALEKTGTYTFGVSATGNTVQFKNGSTVNFSLSSTGNVAMLSGTTLQIGSAFTSGAPTATGYVTIIDSSGTTRKLLCA